MRKYRVNWLKVKEEIKEKRKSRIIGTLIISPFFISVGIMIRHLFAWKLFSEIGFVLPVIIISIYLLVFVVFFISAIIEGIKENYLIKIDGD